MVNNYELLATDNLQLTTVNCLVSSTTVEDPLQISSFLTNKANFPDDQMNVTSFYTVDYENISNWTLGENKPNSKPNKANFQKAKMNVTSFLTKDYENITNWTLFENKPNQTQFHPHRLSGKHLLSNHSMATIVRIQAKKAISAFFAVFCRGVEKNAEDAAESEPASLSTNNRTDIDEVHLSAIASVR